jgi:putative intracellular protease/amidase/mannose/cellobiose epimerase-like protein (N-acyl-D-glucosamine 2-epimerase family)
MTELIRRADGRLAGRTIAILMEGDYVEPELHYYQRRFAEEGAKVEFLTRLWGQSELTFTGHEYQLPFTVSGDLEAVDDERLRGFDALIVPSGMVSDRLRFSADVRELSPAVRLLRRAFDEPSVLKGIICHGMWLVSPIPEVVRGRRVTCHNNLIGDVRNMGADYTDQDVVVDGDLVTARAADRCHLFAHTLIDLIAARADKHLLRTLRENSGGDAVVGTRPVRVPVPEPASVPLPAPAVVASAAADPVEQRPGGVQFSFADLVAGYLTAYDRDSGELDLRTSDGHAVRVALTPTTSAQFLRNLGDPYVDATGHLADLLTPGRHLFAYGVYYPEGGGVVMRAGSLVFLGRGVEDYNFEEGSWWQRQLAELAAFYRRAQFGTKTPVDYADYRTVIRLGGDKADHHNQETDTISRLVYGMASAYMLTGDEDFLGVAERGTEYLRDHMRFVDRDNDVVYWYHGIDVRGDTERKLFTSEFGDDYDAIPAYEQIYGLVGLTQTYRITGDPRIGSDIDGTLRLLRNFFRDPERGGYFSHVDPILLSPHHESLGANRSKKNWNSVGDHAPAYLFNLLLATGDERHVDMLEECFDLIVEHFPDSESPFVQERFHADWSADRSWGWQQDRAVVGHNLKIAWNLMRMNALRPKESYRKLAEQLGRSMPAVGSDQQRGGWYDLVDRTMRDGESKPRFVWHDRKAWWQQEQAILAYLILAGNTGDEEFLRHAREAESFYNAFFLDHDEGGVYFNVLANGMPYLLGNERLKGSHSMSMYHSSELCFLSTVYSRLLVRREPLTLWFKPRPDGFPDRVLRVAPDALPAGRVRLEWVEVDGKPYSAFEAAAMTVKLPDSSGDVTVQAHLVPVEH